MIFAAKLITMRQKAFLVILSIAIVFFGLVMVAGASPEQEPSIGASPEDTSGDTQDLRDLVLQKINDFRASKGLPGFTLNEELNSAARLHVLDMIHGIYYSHVDLSGGYPQDRMRDAGYEPFFWDESMGALAFNNWISIRQAAEIIVEYLVQDALNGGAEGAPLLNPRLKEIGFYVTGAQIYLFESWQNVYAMVLDYGTRRTQIAPTPGNAGGRARYVAFAGHIYRDLNGNGRYDFREGAVGYHVRVTGPISKIYSPIVIKNYRVDISGGFQFYLSKGLYQIDMYYNADGGVEVPVFSTTLQIDDATNNTITVSIPVEKE